MTTSDSTKKRRSNPFGTMANKSWKKSRQTDISSFVKKQVKKHEESGGGKGLVSKMDESLFKDLIMSGVQLRFPYQNPYPGQLVLMSKLIRCLQSSVHGIFESPTGTGKTLSILVSALSWQQVEKEKIAAANLQKKLMEKEKAAGVVLPDIRNNPRIDSMQSAMQATRVPKIYIASRTHRQLEQMILELRNKTGLNPKMAVIGSREQLCIDPEVSSKPNKAEECSKKLDLSSCNYFDHSKTIASIKRSEKEIFDIEDLVLLGKERGGCPYYAAKTLCESADVIFTPYNYVLDPQSSPSEINLSGNILIIDEAHNVESSATDAASIQVKDSELAFAAGDLTSYANVTKSNPDDLKKVLRWFSMWLVKHAHDSLPIVEFDRSMKLWSGSEAVEMMRDGVGEDGLGEKDGGISASLVSKCKTDFEKFCSSPSSSSATEASKLKASTRSVVGKILMILDFLLIKKYHSDFKMAFTKGKLRQNASMRSGDESSGTPVSEIGFEFWCLNSGVIFKELGEKCRSLILTSGTLSPVSSYALELGIPFGHTVEANHVIATHQLWAGVVPSSPSGMNLACTFSNLSKPEFQVQLGLSIIELVKAIPNGCLVFVPSYSWLERLVEVWKTDSNVWNELKKHKDLFVEPSSSAAAKKNGNGDDGNLERLIHRFDRAALSPAGALMFCVYRGKMSEGIDFANEKARGVICVGIPYPNVKSPKLMEAKNYHNRYAAEKNLMNGELWYKTQAFRALNQALGRCIRHQNDFGAVILLDSRFKTQNDTSKLLPKWFQKFLVSHSAMNQVFISLAAFFNNATAMDEQRKRKDEENAKSSPRDTNPNVTLQSRKANSGDTATDKDSTSHSINQEQQHFKEENSDGATGDVEVPSVNDENSPKSALTVDVSSLVDNVAVPDTPPESTVSPPLERPHFTDTIPWSCSKCKSKLLDSSYLSILPQSPFYPQTVLDSSELCDIGEFESDFIMNETRCGMAKTVDCHQDFLQYTSLICVSCRNLVGFYMTCITPLVITDSGVHPFAELNGHVVFLSSKTIFQEDGRCAMEGTVEEFPESLRLDDRCYSEEFSPLDLEALGQL